MFDVIDYGGGNIGSLLRCLERLEIPCRTIKAAREISTSNPLILPGVGNFGSVMNSLTEAGFADLLVLELGAGRPFLGICIGMQVLFESSEESSGIAGLHILAGKVLRYKTGKIPQIGWNRIIGTQPNVAKGDYVYFVNSYYVEPQNGEIVMFKSEYHGEFCAAVCKNNITAFQFHPEKSGSFGNELIRKWADAL